MVLKKISKDQRGQATTEYLLLLSIIVAAFITVSRGLRSAKIGDKLLGKIKTDFAMAYKYGDPRARGPDEGAPKFHPRVVGGDNNFRIFVNPEGK